MPKTEKTPRDPWASWRGMVLEAKKRLDLTLDDIAERLQHRTYGGYGHPSRQMVSRWINNPDCMPLWAFARINRILEIEAEEARKAAVVWR
jgi:hypothetical protein